MIVVVGAGVAGLTAVEHLGTAGVPVTLLTAGHFTTGGVSASNTALAQGGIAVARHKDDSPAQQLRDAVATGAGLVDPTITAILTTVGPNRIRELLAAGFPPDRDSQGQLAFGLAAAHSRARVRHAGEDSTGTALPMFLTNRVQQLADNGRVQIPDPNQANRTTWRLTTTQTTPGGHHLGRQTKENALYVDA